MMINKNFSTFLFRGCLLFVLALRWAATSNAQTVNQPVNFGTVNVCAGNSGSQCTKKITTTLSLSSFQLKSPQIVVLTDGAENLDFTLASHVCAGVLCTVSINFTPAFPGLRRGAIEVTDASGAILSTTMIYGVGYGAQLGFGFNNQSSVAAAPGAAALAVDGAGSLYFAQPSQKTVTKITSSGTWAVVASGFASKALATDGAGNLYIGDSTNERVWKVSRAGQQSIVASNVQPIALSVAADGTLNIADDLGSQLLQRSPAGKTTQVMSGWFPGLAFDQKNNLYVQCTPSDVVEYSHDVLTKIWTMSADLENATLAVDAAGSVYSATAQSLQQLTSEGPTAISGGYPTAVAIDKAANIYYSDSYQPTIFQIVRGTPSQLMVLSLGETRTQTIENTGNAPMSELMIEGDAAVAATSHCPQTLAPGESCTIALNAKSSAQSAKNPVTISYQSNGISAQVTALVNVINPNYGLGITTTLYANKRKVDQNWTVFSASFDTKGAGATGTMSYTANGQQLCNLPVVENTTSCRISTSVASGITSYKVVYSGDGVFRSSTASGN